MAKGFFNPTFNRIRDNKNSIKKSLVLKEKRKGNNNSLKVYNLRETRVQEFKGVLLHIP